MPFGWMEPQTMRQHFLLWLTIGLFGACGALLRYAVCDFASHWSNRFPWGTFLVNVTGCFLLGALAYAARVEHPAMSPFWRTALAMGFLGALTTFSTFGLETIDRLSLGMWDMAAANVLANVGMGLLAVLLGEWTIRIALLWADWNAS